MENLFDKKPSAGGSFGKWITDEFGLPAYEYTCDQDRDSRAKRFTTQGPSSLHWHAFGNNRFNVIATNRGEVQALESSRGLQWLNYFDPNKHCPGAGITILEHSRETKTDLYDKSNSPEMFSRIFGTSYFRKILAWNDLSSDNLLFAPFGDDPVLAAVLVLKNNGKTKKTIKLMELFGVNLHYLTAAPVFTTSARKHFVTNQFMNYIITTASGAASSFTDANKIRSAFSDRFIFNSELRKTDSTNTIIIHPVYTGKNMPPPSKSSSKNYHPYSMFLLSDKSMDVFCSDARHMYTKNNDLRIPGTCDTKQNKITHPCLAAGTEITLDPGEIHKTAFLFGYCKENEINNLVNKYTDSIQSPDIFARENMSKIRQSAPVLTVPEGPWNNEIMKETQWHGSYSTNSFLHDEWYGLHYLPQGGPYEYLHGFRGGVRDLSLFAMGLIYLNPSLSRELILYMFHQMTPDGRVMYAAHGFGKATGAVIHENPSDLQLFLLMALTEYIFFTREFELLDQQIIYHGNKRKSATVLEAVVLSIDYLFNRIGTGSHGLVRSGDGDWNDGISMFVKNRIAFVRNGESMFNTAMALYVLPRISSLLSKRTPDLSIEIRSKVNSLKNAALKCRNDKWFYRGYDGKGTPIGDKELFLEHHTWLLISDALNQNDSLNIIDAIKSILDNPSHFGQFVLFPPIDSFMGQLHRGWDVNGGIWFAMNFLLTWAYSKFDKNLGWNSLIKNSMAMKATVDPDIWYGIWSGPDSFNACYADRPGETFFHLPTPCTDFPVMNLNLHAGFISALVKLCGIEPGMDGTFPEPRLPFKDFSFKTPTFSINVQNGDVDFKQLQLQY